MSGWYDNGRVYHIELSLQAVAPLRATKSLSTKNQERAIHFQERQGLRSFQLVLRVATGNGKLGQEETNWMVKVLNCPEERRGEGWEGASSP